MSPDFEPFASYSRPVPGAEGRLYDRVASALFPFRLTLAANESAYLSWDVRAGGWPGLIGIAGSLLAVFAVSRLRRSGWRAMLPNLLLVAATGLFGLLATLLVPLPREWQR